MEIKVKCYHFDRYGGVVLDYQNTIKIDPGIVFEYRNFYDCLSLLYPRSRFIQFDFEVPKSSQDVV